MVAIIATIFTMSATAQTAKSVLDKTAAAVSNKGGITAKFTISSPSIKSMSGTLQVKGRKFHATTPQATIWFDGKTQWTYMKNNEEVNVSNPTDAELQAINPYNFINIYKSGYKYSMTSSGGKYQVHLTATDKKRSIQEMYITVNKSTYVPSQVKMKQNKKWTTITISNFKKTNLSDSSFRFNAKQYPNAEIIDLR